MLLRFRDSIRTTQHSADAEVIASQKQKETLNTFKICLQVEEKTADVLFVLALNYTLAKTLRKIKQ